MTKAHLNRVKYLKVNQIIGENRIWKRNMYHIIFWYFKKLLESYLKSIHFNVSEGNKSIMEILFFLWPIRSKETERTKIRTKENNLGIATEQWQIPPKSQKTRKFKRLITLNVVWIIFSIYQCWTYLSVLLLEEVSFFCQAVALRNKSSWYFLWL